MDDILTSCYAIYNAEQSFIHMLFLPLRILHHMHVVQTDNIQAQEGIHWYPRALMYINTFI